MNYKMFSDDALKHFGKFCDASNFSRPRNPEGAFDAKPRYARDAAPQATPEKDNLIRSLLGVIDEFRPKTGANDQEPFDDIPDALHQLSENLKGTLPPDAFKEAEELIIKLIERTGELIKVAHEAENRSNATTGNGPPEFNGKPAMDAAALDSFNARFPGAARIGQDSRFGEQPTQRARPPTTAAIDSFARMFPDTKRIGNV